MAAGVNVPACVLILLNFLTLSTIAQVLTPPTFNLAEGRHITASSTCGYGVAEPELFCSLTGATGEFDKLDLTKEIIQGQLCDYCDPSQTDLNHTAQFAIDGTERWWQSPPLSRGNEFNEVDIVIDLEQEFHIAYLILKMANSPRPGVWVLEKSEDYGETWKPWQYFADTPSDCQEFFGTEVTDTITADDQVICTTEYSRIVPLENGEIVVSLVNDRPNAHNFSYADKLRDFMMATNVRIKLLRTKTLLGHLMAVARQDPTVTRRYFYSIKDISIGGRCVCNGHADNCNYKDPLRPKTLICECQHNTVGDQCERCDAAGGFVQKKWEPARAYRIFECEPCQCFGRATGCEYDPVVDEEKRSLDIHGFYSGGGVCQNCGYNSTGINCEKCLPGFFRPYGVAVTRLDMCMPCDCDPHFHTGECDEGTGRCECRPEFAGEDCDSCSLGYYGYPDCIPCDCDVNGTEGGVCHVNGGQCPCRSNFVGKKCNMCQLGYYNFPECGACECNGIGAVDTFCDVESGQCRCQLNYGGRDCSECNNGYFNYPDCSLCDCDPLGTTDEICDAFSGECLCQDNFNGDKCGECARGYYRFPDCLACQCKEPGSLSNDCNLSGQCSCKVNFAGLNCERCAAGYYKYPDCVPCNCDLYGSVGMTCDQEIGQCDCRYNFQGLMCEKCRENLYNYPNCEECNCNPAGAKEVPGYPLGGCGEVISGRLCECKERVIGRICDTCKPGYWNLNRNNPLGCEVCTCSDAGTIAGMNVCNMITGQCMCKVDVSGRNCDRCRDGFYGLHKTNLFGCVECNCDVGGSISNVCDKETGQCPCKPRVEGKRCDQPILSHFIPTLDQMKYEIEDGRTPEGTQIRYGYDDRLFPNYSWKGYAILMQVQPEVLFDVEINKPSLYRLVYRFVNRNEQAVRGDIKFTPESYEEIQQQSSVVFNPTDVPSFVEAGENGGLSTFVLNPGRWTISVKASDSVFLDYVILIPQAYYEATVLQNTVQRPCVVPGDGEPCLHYSYPELIDFPRAQGEDGYVIGEDGQRIPVHLFNNQQVLDELGINSMAILDKSQQSFNVDLDIPENEEYVLLVNYHTTGNNTQTLLFNVGEAEATAILYNCQYSTLCRQVLAGLDEMEAVFDIETGTTNIKITGDENVNAAIESIVAVPYDKYKVGYIRPSIVCIRINGVCVGSRFSSPTGAVRVDFETFPNDHLLAEFNPAGVPSDVGLVKLNGTQNLIVLLGTAKGDGPHKFLVHYYMPKDIGEDMSVEVHANGQVYDGIFRPRYCPGLQGCRGIIYFKGGSKDIINLKDTDVKLVFNNTGDQEIWMDYVLFMPPSQFNPQNVRLLPVDNSNSFINTCLDEGYMVIQPVSDFCRMNLFTLTTEFNNGALDCECDIDGSLSLTCDAFGGQCQCRPNVIGRTCQACRVGYYGFPRCKPCNCPFGLCHSLTGACICPPRVTGERCDVCMSGTYGYDALIGCEECLCNSQGVVDQDMNCQEDSGQCSCLPGIGGRRCDSCQPGYHSFPRCQKCECEEAGTVEEICDPNTAYCLCKSNVVGPRCEQCDTFTFNLDGKNPSGCTSCFCFGTTSTCRESGLFWTKVTDMEGWGITNTVDGGVREAGTTIAVLDALDKIDRTDTPMYWTAPQTYLGNMVTSYGGKLTYQVLFVAPRNDSLEVESLSGPDVVLQGNNMTILHYAYDQPAASVVTDMSVELVERNFRHPDSGAMVDREQFMMILVNLQALHIRGSYISLVQEIRLMEVEVEVATVIGEGEVAKAVEECQCPYGYTGTSCENCSPGYYRATSFPFLGTCIPCNCNNHADVCDSQTGVCLDCADNTYGDHCELCLPGYYGNPAFEGCSICGCPLDVDSNNFADSCSVVSGGLVVACDCYEGYTGSRCDRCAAGYYGDPREVGSTCERCSCSGNIDMNDPESCDFLSGACLICVNNTTGPQCERCKDWWYGDAIVEKDCTACTCDQCGSVMCGTGDGVCTCKPNVVGDDCDSCAPDYYGFDQCNGCMACDCAPAAVDTQCDLQNGTCFCQPGVTGRRCESCISGYWNYQESGCDMCDCEFDGATTCNPEDGSCVCLPGVTGEMCDTCLDRWVLVPNEGCRECDVCVHYLIDDVEYLDRNMSYTYDALQTVSIGVAAMNRMDNINQTVYDLMPIVNSVLYESDNITLEPAQEEFNQLALITSNVQTRTQTSVSDANQLTEDGKALVVSGDEALVMADNSDKEASDAVGYVQEVLTQILQGIQVTNIETYVTLTEQLIDDIRSRNFTSEEMDIDIEMELATELLERVKAEQMKPSDQMKYSEEISTRLSDQDGRLRSVLNSSFEAEDVMTTAYRLTKGLQDDVMVSIKTHTDELVVVDKETRSTLDMSENLLVSAYRNLDNATEEFRKLEIVSSTTRQAQSLMNTWNRDYIEGLEKSSPLVNDSITHAEGLMLQADELENIYTDTRDTSANAVLAGRAYDKIVQAIDDAKNASEMALIAAEDALSKSSGVGTESQVLISSSEDLLMDAKIRYNTTQTDLFGRLNDAVEGSKTVEVLNQNVRDEEASIRSRYGQLPIDKAGRRAVVVKSDSEEVVSQVEDSNTQVSSILVELPGHLQKAGPLVRDVSNTNREINLAKTQVGTVKKFVPEITTLLTDLTGHSDTVKKLGAQVTGNINALREKIAIARNQANLIRVGLKFVGNTSVTLRNPRNVAQAGSYSKVSLFVKTGVQNALLLYAGPKTLQADRPNQDFMSLELEDGKVVFKFELGTGMAKITHPHYVSDNIWYKITAKRIGKAGTLTLNRDPKITPELGEMNGESPGINTVLELNPLTTTFFVGGVPAGTTISNSVSRVFYTGMMEDVEFDEKPMGLWNFRAGENNHNGARERNVLTSVVSNGFRFDGSGYVILSQAKTGWKPSVKLDVTLKFKTYAENGLIFFAGKGRDFVSIEIRDGKILFQFDLGKGRARLETSETFNDGEWHDIQISRRNRLGVLLVDQVKISEEESPEGLTQLSITDEISVGGYHDIILPASDVTKQGFEGCIQDLALQVRTWDLNDNVKAKGVSPGCPEQVARVATFSSDRLSYVAKPSDSIGENFDITFKMKTLQENALLFYVGRTDEAAGFSVSVVDGKIVVISDAGDGKVELMNRANTYNDGRWHYISVMKMGSTLKLNIDDYQKLDKTGDGGPSIQTDTPLYFGNADISIPEGLAGSTLALSGCIGDVTVNGVFLNFATLQPSKRPGISLSGCPIPDPEGVIDSEVLPTFFPTVEVSTEVMTEPVTLPPGTCALPVTMPRDLNQDDEIRGITYGNYPISYVEYDKLPGSLRIKSVISLEFKTVAKNGVMLYITDTRHIDFISLILKDGKIRYAFDSGTGPGVITSPKNYNDGNWHMVKMGRNQHEGSMQIDGEDLGVTRSRGRARSINCKPPYYVGGYIEEVPKAALDNLNYVTSGFQGCIANIRLNDAELGPPVRQTATRPCAVAEEQGAYFYDNGGYIKLADSFNVGLELTIEVQIRPRSLDGVLFSVHSSREDFVVLQLVDGELRFTADNGAGSITANFVPPKDNKLCDGTWHKVKARKIKNVVMLEVDDYDQVSDTSRASATSADTSNPIYLGGKPDAIRKGIRANGSYKGCMRALMLNDKPQYLATGIAFDSVKLEACPAN